MRFLWAAVAVIFVVVTSCYRPEPREAMSDLHQLAGNWSSEQVQFFEAWEVVSDTLMKGIGYSLQEKDTVFKETMKIFYTDNRVILSVKQDEERAYTQFGMTEARRDKWIFENRQNNYPNIITYEISGDELTAAIMNSRGNRKIEFNMKRR